MRLSLTRKRRVTGSACGSTVRTRAFAVTDGSSASATVMIASGGAPRKTWAETSNTASRPSCRATVKIDCPGCTTSPASADRAVIVPETFALSSVKLNRSCAMSSCAFASSTRACAVCRAWFAESKIARVVKPRSIRWFWRSKLFCASTSWPRAALSAACAERTPLSSSCGSSFASTWSGSTLSPTPPLRSMIRPPMRKARFTSFSARMSPVSWTASPIAPFSTVTVRTGRGCGGSVLAS